LLSTDKHTQFAADIRTEYASMRAARAARGLTQRLVSIKDARANRAVIDLSLRVPTPTVADIETLAQYPLAELVERIDWTPFFQTWELSGHYPAILSDPVVGDSARTVFADAKKLLDRIVREGLLEARAAFGFWPANSVGDDIEIYADENRTSVITTLHMLRQQMDKKGDGRPNFCLADYVAPRDSGVLDYMGGFAVTAGHGLETLVAEFEADHDDYGSIMAKALADRLAEAFAERLHERVRREYWGYAPDEALENAELIKESYQGIRPAPGYPACPDHTEKAALFALLDAERRAGINLTESFAMFPGAAVSGWYFWRPESTYFGVGKVLADQVAEYAARKGWDEATAARWLAPNLAE